MTVEVVATLPDGGAKYMVKLPGAMRVRVRHRPSLPAAQWRCDACGTHTDPVCPHAAAATAHTEEQDQ